MNEIKGDLLASGCDVIAHGCNCFNTMGAGVAKAVVAKYPEARKADLCTRKGDKSKLGHFSMAKTADGTTVYNLYTQYNYGRGKRFVSYEAVRSALKAMRESIEHLYPHSQPRIGLPRIGAGLAGGNWNIIKQIIEEELDGMDVSIYYL